MHLGTFFYQAQALITTFSLQTWPLPRMAFQYSNFLILPLAPSHGQSMFRSICKKLMSLPDIDRIMPR